MEQKIERAIHKLIDNDIFFRVNKNVFARHFLNDVLKIDVFQLSKEEVSKKICEKFRYKLESLPHEEELYQFVAHRIMKIKEDKEPYEHFNHEVFLVMEDLRKINSMIQEYQSKQEDKGIDRYAKKKYEYLVVKLSKAKDGICEYMTGEIKLCVYREVKDWDQIFDLSHFGSFKEMLPA